MFETLQAGLTDGLKTLAGRGRLTEANMREGLRLVQNALLEADVSYPVAKEFIDRVSAEARGERVLRSLNPTQQLFGVVQRELIDLMGPVDHSLHLRPDSGTLMLCGLQGSGKTTTCAKMGRMLKSQGRKPLLVAADLQRPAAIEQLRLLGEREGIDVYTEEGATDPVAVCQRAIGHAKSIGANVVLLDTAGRLHVDEELMDQLRAIDRRVQPDQVYLVVDAMTGQDAVNSAKVFNEALELDGVIMTKLDGDARGGAALSVKYVTGVPIKFIGVGEQADALEEFHPDRIAGRILGHGDILTLVEQAQRKVDQEELARQQERLQKGEFTLDDFRSLIDQTRRLGPMQQVMSMIPGFGNMLSELGDADADGEMKRLRGIIDSMTPDERRDPKIIDHSRRHRIATGAGVPPQDVNNLIKQFEPLAEVMRSMSGMGVRGRMQAMQNLMQQATSSPGGRLGKVKKGTGKRLSKAEKERLKKQREREKRRKRREQKKKR